MRCLTIDDVNRSCIQGSDNTRTCAGEIEDEHDDELKKSDDSFSRERSGRWDRREWSNR